MGNAGGTGALSRLGITPWPIGTLEEVQEQGLDPIRVASCHADVPGVVRGCPLWKDCPFHLKRYGGFKGQGPRYVPYFLRTHEGNSKEDFISCYSFVRGLLARMRAGMAEKEEGKAHEVVRILGGEGTKIVRRDYVPNNEADKTITADYHFERRVIETPAFPRPGDRGDISYEAELEERERERQAFADEVEDMAYSLPEEGEETKPEAPPEGGEIDWTAGEAEGASTDATGAEPGPLATPVEDSPEPQPAKKGKRDG